ncbi:MAG: hypothetical protein DRJ64_10750, partial [Thermoprotei archaeon]
DTAGLRSTNCSIEQEGIRRSRNAAKEADIIINLYDSSQISCDEVSLNIESFSNSCESILLSIGNKCDLLATKHKKTSDGVFISALTGEGLDDLFALLVSKAIELTGINDAEGVVMASLRQKNDTLEAVSYINQAIESLKSSTLDQAADDFKYTSESLLSLLGEIKSSQVIEEIFSNFCLGK